MFVISERDASKSVVKLKFPRCYERLQCPASRKPLAVSRTRRYESQPFLLCDLLVRQGLEVGKEDKTHRRRLIIPKHRVNGLAELGTATLIDTDVTIMASRYPACLCKGVAVVNTLQDQDVMKLIPRAHEVLPLYQLIALGFL